MNNSVEDNSPPHTINIGRGHQFFDIKLSIETFRNPSQIIPLSHHNPCWLSYRFMGRVVQSEILTCNTTNATVTSASFTPMIHTFRVCSSYRELMQHFNDKKNRMLRVHVCTTGRVLGTALIDLLPLFEKREGSKTEEEIDLLDGGGRMVSGEYDVRPLNEMKPCDDETNTNALLAVSVCLESVSGQSTASFCKQDNLQPSSTRIRSSTSSQTDIVTSDEIVEDCASSPIESKTNEPQTNAKHTITPRQKQLQGKEAELKQREEQLHQKETKLYELEITLEKKRRDWENWRHEQELKFHETLRQKEASTMRAIDERACNIEKERLDSLESSRKEYEVLESRLRNALLEVESKERRLNEVEAMHQNERQRKMAELDLRERLMKEELQHTIDIEASRAKTNAAIEKAIAAEKSAAAAGSKIKVLEDEIDEIRAKHRNTPEVALLQQMAEVKGQLADSQRRIETIKAEKAEIVLEKEQFRASVNKLAKALRHERDKAAARKESNRQQQVRLSYDKDDNAFVIGGSQDEVQRILSDLSNLSKLQSPKKSFVSPSKQGSSHCQQQKMGSESGSRSSNSVPPIPSPQPTRPCPSPLPSMNGSSNCGYSIDFDQIISTPS